MIAKLKSPYVDRLNRPYATGDDKKRKVAEAFEALNSFIRRYGGAVTSPPGKVLRVEVPKGSPLPAKLAELGYNVAACGTVTRIVGADYVSPHDEFYGARASPFAEYLVFEIQTDGK